MTEEKIASQVLLETRDFVNNQANFDLLAGGGQTGEIISVMDSIKEGGSDFKLQAIQYKQFNKALSNPAFKTDAAFAGSAMGIDNIRNGIKLMTERGQTSDMFRVAGAASGRTPFEFATWVAEAAGIEPPQLSPTAQKMADAIANPFVRRYYTNPTSERVALGNGVVTGNVPSLAVREGLPKVGDRQLSSFAPQVSSVVMEDDDGQPGMDIFFEDHKFPAVLGGVVKEVGYQGNQEAGYGNYVVIESIDPLTNQPVDVLYGHLEMPTHFKVGTTVLPGMIIGNQGGTGSVKSADGTIESIDFLAPAPAGSNSMVPYSNFRQLREAIARQLGY